MTFGDSDPDDAYDPTVPPDPVQVARRLHAYRAHLEGDPVGWDGLDDHDRAVAVEVVRRLLAWLVRSGHLWAPVT